MFITTTGPGGNSYLLGQSQRCGADRHNAVLCTSVPIRDGERAPAQGSCHRPRCHPKMAAVPQGYKWVACPSPKLCCLRPSSHHPDLEVDQYHSVIDSTPQNAPAQHPVPLFNHPYQSSRPNSQTPRPALSPVQHSCVAKKGTELTQPFPVPVLVPPGPAR
jgi:hypothetical protein